MNHLHSSVGQQPLFIVGYSNGGALAVHYALTSLEKDSLPPAQGLVLLSPEIGLTKIAALAIWQERLGRLLGLRKLAWNSILPEYDPYKYNSFTVNAAVQARLLTVEIQEQITRYESSGELTRLPPILAFQSVVDATVTAPALVEGLFQRLPARGHEMVLFDINRTAEIEHVLNGNPTAWIDRLLRDTITAFRVTALTNEDEESESVVSLSREAGEAAVVICPTDLVWPEGLYSLSHVALPFPPDDPLYGGPEAGESPGIQLGDVALRGEHGVLQIGPAAMLRLRWNPFHSYLEQRTLEFTGLSPLAQGACGH
jgi:alpha-beta hydrolase superfamily lysophospholipase